MTLRAVWNAPAAAALGLLCGLVLARCQVQLDPNGVYSCAADSDCGGGGYKCAPNDAGTKYCCLPAAEICDGVDNDCNGVVDDVAPTSCFPFDAGTAGVGRCVAGQSTCGGACQGAVGPLAETCNSADDNCDGRIDDGFDLLNDPANCGQCDHACPVPDGGAPVCFDGGCLVPNELNCSDGLDEDNDGLTDCADPDCNMQNCGVGCRCAGFQPTEIACRDMVNNDRDDAGADCADPDCNLQSCGVGCECRAGAATETNCSDGLNNDQDLAGADCADPDCELEWCGAGCLCLFGTAIEVLCADRVNNDRDDAGTDCADPDCNLQTCGAGCRCLSGAAFEMRCWDGLNNDSDDAGTDCADPDCADAGCGADGGVDCLCVGGQASERVCNDNLDNDRDDAGIDCADSDCNFQSCGAGCTCLSGVAVETRCWDGLNNDSDDAGTDCVDPDCAGAGCGADGGSDCLCIGGQASESACDDNLDNDGDGNIDCRDTADCPPGTPCDATGGTCQNNRQCK